MRVKIPIVLGLALVALSSSASPTPPLDDFLRTGRIRDGLTEYAAPTDNSARFSLALLQALDGLQQFAAELRHLELNPEIAQSGLPFLRVAVPAPQAPAGEAVTPEKVAALFSRLKQALRQANETLATIDAAPFQVPVNISQARLDLDGDGRVATNEFVLASLGRPLGLPASQPGGKDLVIHFDSADAVWLKGYTHFLLGLLDLVTAYDWTPVWNQCAHVIFRNPQPLPPIAQYAAPGTRRDMTQILDLIAALHEMRLELKDPRGPRNARDHFQAMIGCSRVCWQRVLAETDNDHEWLPSPLQTGPGGAQITAQQIEGWTRILDEAESVLKGEKLLGHWRMKPGWGINVDKFVAAPPKLDLVLWIQGSSLIPYLEEGPTSDRNTWRSLMQPFGPGFARFALWSN